MSVLTFITRGASPLGLPDTLSRLRFARPDRARDARLESIFVAFARLTIRVHLTEEAPARAVARQVIQAHVPRRRLQPSAGCRISGKLRVALEGAQEDRLRRIFGVGR